MAGQKGLGEFDMINKYLEPLTHRAAGAANLSDDAAVLPTRDGYDLVVTMDTLISGVHFLEFTPPHFVAAKTLRVNLSDLAAMGAIPAYYTLSLSLPKDTDENWLEAFSQALGLDQDLYGITLVGGDTVATPGPLSLSIAAFGWVEQGRQLTRSGARAGDLVYVSGPVGDAWLGLSVVRGGYPDLPTSSLDHLTERYHRPQPRLDLGRRLQGLASAAIDISDGLVQDLGHICETSQVRAVIQAADVPLSRPARTLADEDRALIPALLSGGDDYELLFTVPSQHQTTVSSLATELNLPLTIIGVIEDGPEGPGVSVLDEGGNKMPMANPGYQHF